MSPPIRASVYGTCGEMPTSHGAKCMACILYTPPHFFGGVRWEPVGSRPGRRGDPTRTTLLESWKRWQDSTHRDVFWVSDIGYDGMTHQFHELYRNHLIRSEYKDKKRPILINNWEATYFDFNTENYFPLQKSSGAWHRDVSHG